MGQASGEDFGVEGLMGFLEGALLDYELTDAELTALRRLVRGASSRDVASSAILSDLAEVLGVSQSGDESVLTEGSENREGIVALLQAVVETHSQDLKAAPEHIQQRLLGVLGGLLADDRFTLQEAVDLEDFLEEFGDNRDEWPVSTVGSLLEGISSEKFSERAATSALRTLMRELR